MVVYFLHPTITKYTIGIFFCIELEDGEYWLQSDLEVRCWTEEHLKFCLIIGIPMIIIWVVGLPSLAFVHLFRNRRKLEDEDFSRRYRVIYRGLKREKFYWEFINILRKVYIVISNVVMQTSQNLFKAMFILLAITYLIRAQ